MKHLLFTERMVISLCICISKRVTFCDLLRYAGEHWESREDGANHQRVPNSQQQMGSDLLPVQREDRSMYTGRVTAHVALTKTLFEKSKA